MAESRDPFKKGKDDEERALSELGRGISKKEMEYRQASPDPSLNQPGAHNTPPVPEKNPIQFRDKVVKPKPTFKERQSAKAESEGRLLDLSQKAASQRQARTGTTSFSTGQSYTPPETPTMAKIDLAAASKERKAARTTKAASKATRAPAAAPATSKAAFKPTVPSSANTKAREAAYGEMTSSEGKLAVAQAKNPRKHPSIDNYADTPKATTRVAPSAPPTSSSGTSDWIDAAISGAKAKAASTRKPRTPKVSASSTPKPVKNTPATASEPPTNPTPAVSVPPPPKAAAPVSKPSDRMSRDSIVGDINAGSAKPKSATPPPSTPATFDNHADEATNLANSGHITPTASRTGATPPKSSESVRSSAFPTGPTPVSSALSGDSGGFPDDEAKARRAVDVFRSDPMPAVQPRSASSDSSGGSPKLTVHGTISPRRGSMERHAVVSHGGSNYSIPEGKVRSLGSADIADRPSSTGFHDWALNAGGKHLGNYMPTNVDTSDLADETPSPPRSSGPRFARPAISNQRMIPDSPSPKSSSRSKPRAGGTGPFPEMRQSLSTLSSNRKLPSKARFDAANLADDAMGGNPRAGGGLKSTVSKSRGPAHPVSLVAGGAKAIGKGIKASIPSVKENAQAFFHPSTPVQRTSNLQPRQFPGSED